MIRSKNHFDAKAEILQFWADQKVLNRGEFNNRLEGTYLDYANDGEEIWAMIIGGLSYPWKARLLYCWIMLQST